MKHYFGTDGIRGRANQEPMTPDTAMRLGKAVALNFSNHKDRPKIVIGKDTRLSGYMFEAAIAAGINAVGGDVLYTGPLPTPGIAYMTVSMRANAGIVISASHNPFEDNGIKIFGADGFKLPDQDELLIEALMDDEPKLLEHMASCTIGRSKRLEDARGRYIVFLKSSFPKTLTLKGLKIVVDCANGAAYKVAPSVLWELGADVIQTGVTPNGTNINDQCGALYPKHCAARVLESDADIGITLDGDADRVILIDEKGQIVDGDHMLAMAAFELHRLGKLPHRTVVGTVMSNLGLELALQSQDIQLIRTHVGDRYVVETMRKQGLALGGEQSGHLIFLNHSTTGDGMVAALFILALMQSTQKPLSELRRIMQPIPQVMKNIEVAHKPNLNDLEDFQKHLREVRQKLGDQGRVLVRYSGTEPKARIMIEGMDFGLIHQYAEALGQHLRQSIQKASDQ